MMLEKSFHLSHNCQTPLFLHYSMHVTFTTSHHFWFLLLFCWDSRKLFDEEILCRGLLQLLELIWRGKGQVRPSAFVTWAKTFVRKSIKWDSMGIYTSSEGFRTSKWIAGFGIQHHHSGGAQEEAGNSYKTAWNCTPAHPQLDSHPTPEVPQTSTEMLLLDKPFFFFK